MLPILLISAFNAILFLQSGLDKVFNYRENLNYLRGVFKNSLLAGTVGVLMPVITVLELAAGACSAGSVLLLLLGNSGFWPGYAAILSAVTLLCLFFGQRMAKDYGGAAGIVPYFLVALAGVWLCWH